MHELSLCRNIYTIVDRARGERSVQTIHLRVGQLRQVIPETLEHCWGYVTDQTPLAASRLRIEHVPITLSCEDCRATTRAPQRLMLVCGECGSGRIAVTTGEEFIVTTMDVTEESELVHG